MNLLQEQCITEINLLIKNKEHRLEFLKEDLQFLQIEDNLLKSNIKQKITLLQNHIQNTICSSLPNALWERKKHVVDLPYEPDFSEANIPTKDRPTQMNRNVLKFCQTEIDDLSRKKFIRKRKSPWSCSAFYVNKAAEIEKRNT